MIHQFELTKIWGLALNLPTWAIVLLCIIVFMGIVGQWTLYAKCNLPGYAALVPVWNVFVFLRIVGRPSSQGWIVMVPPVIALALILFIPNLYVGFGTAALVLLPWAYFMIKVYIEICQCFGKKSVASYVLIVIFNGIYLFNLAMSQEEKYLGPVYKVKE